MSKAAIQKKFEANGRMQTVFSFFDDVFGEADVAPFAIRLWDGSIWHHGNGNPHFTLELKHPGALDTLFRRPTELTLGEAYIFDDFDIQGDLKACFDLGDHLIGQSRTIAEKLRLAGQIFRLRAVRRRESHENRAARLKGRLHSRERDKEAIRYHYDVSNDFYRLWLDQRMVYSCAFFHSPQDSLDEAQLRKLDYICRKLRLKPGERLLDIGCGWGGMIIHAAQNYGVNAVGITLSEPQAELANARIREAGLEDHCRVEVCDYRDLDESEPFDKLVSIGMFEHVGEQNLPTYFEKAYDLLKPGGVFLNHGITLSMMNPPAKGPTFIDKYVFPDGDLLPVSTSLRIAEQSRFEIRDVECLREHYALTLRNWVERLEANRDEAISLTSPVTYRIWRIYMSGSAHGFKTGRISLHQTLLARSENKEGPVPLTRCDWYRPCPNGHH
ncbi:MAG: cyclopropane-fatty-acyl-phospholipid synthase family protein [Thermodesulfobacteriota bacterium]|jgi:cyclopropane-fatty-acyl-phospholipid synthase|nr:cyclopropane-fatty-acyl-phospholipid synthase family protein [Thermodesulfobacteriota bacterium]